MAAADDVKRNREEARKLIETVDDARAAALLKGAWDLHVHSGPSTMPRQVDHMQAAEEAIAAGMRGLLFKDHHYSVAPFIPLMDRLLDRPGFTMFSGLVMNNSTGGFNPYVVDAQLKMGAKLVWMPTAQAANHVRSSHRKTRLASNVQLKSSPLLSPLDAQGNVLDVVKEILDSIAEFDAILSSGHLHVWEIWKLFDEARARGVKRLLINHPMYGLHFTYDDIRDLAKLGALVEQSAGLYLDSRFNTYSPQELKEHIDAAGVENSSIGSDLGQVDNPTPVEGMRQVIKLCLALGYSDDEVRMMVSTNPGRLVGVPADDVRYVQIARPGGPEVLEIVDGDMPSPGPGEVLVRVVAAGVNRPDVQQRRGLYPPPPGTTAIPGLDVAGMVHQIGPDVTEPGVGDAVCALANGGGYAEFCIVPAVQCMPLPRGFTFAQAASLPEVFFTAWNNVVWLGRLGRGEVLLVHGGTSGVGMAAIQIARQLRNARVLATAGTPEKRAVAIDTGAEAAFDYSGDWDREIRSHLGGAGVDVILDGQAGPNTRRQLGLLNFDGRAVFIASHEGQFAEIDMRQLVRRRLTVTGSTLRPRDAAYKGRLGRTLVEQVWPLLEDGRIATRIHEVFPLDDVRAAHEVLDANRQVGKVVLAVDAALANRAPRPR